MRALAAAVVATGLVAFTPTPAGACTAGSTRVAGADRIDTAIAISKLTHPNGGSAGAAVLVRSDDFADGLAAAPLAFEKNAPILLTPTGSLDPRTRDELQRAVPGGSTVFILGGASAVSGEVEVEVARLGYHINRLAGTNRFDTAVMVAKAEPGQGLIFLANGRDFPDAVIASPIAASMGGRVLLTDGATMPRETKDYLAADGQQVRFAIGDAAAEADPGAIKVAGADRYETSTVAANQFFGGTKQAFPFGTTGTDPKSVGVATGLNWPDALAAAPFLVSAGGGPMLLTRPDRITEAAANYVGSRAGTILTAVVFGSEDVVGKPVKQRVDEEIEGACGP